VAKFRADQAKKYISLNETERRKERDEAEAVQKRRQEERVKLDLSLDPVAADAIDDGLQAGERDVVKDAAREKAAENRPDPLLRESAAILGDAMGLLVANKALTAQVLPESQSPLHWAGVE
jgi:carboxyl-terminal processing protease